MAMPNRAFVGWSRLSAHRLGDLFRAEVTEARKQRVQGEIILAQPFRAHVLTLLLVVIVALAASWVILGTYTRSEVARGILVTDKPSAKIVAIRPGQIVELAVGDGDFVRKGQRLATVLVEQSNELGASSINESLEAIDAQRSLADEQARLADERAVAERMRFKATLDGVARQRSDLAHQISLQLEVVASNKATLERLSSVMDKGFVSRIEYERRRQTMLAEEQRLAQLRQQTNALFAEERRTLADLARVEADAGSQIATAKSSFQALSQHRAQIVGERGYIISAPIAGRVTALQTALGRTVESSTPLMAIIPEGSTLHAEIYAPTRAIGFVRPSQEVRLLYDAFPYQRFGSFTGRVSRVSRTVLDPHEIAAPLKIEEPVYRIEIHPDGQNVEAYGQTMPLQSGMTLSANLILDRRSFADWLLKPLNAVLNRNR